MPRKNLDMPDTAIPRENPAHEMLRVKKRKEAEKKQAELDAANAGSIFFFKCPRDPGHHAGYLTESPPDMIEPRHWHSEFKTVEQGWDRPGIPCQECFMEGDSREWLVPLRPHRQQSGQFHFSIAVPAKHVFGQVSREEYEVRLKGLEAWTTNTAPTTEPATQKEA